MRLLITLILVIASVFCGWYFYPDLFKAISGKEPVLKSQQETQEKDSSSETTKSADA